jgi:hypothetical protein
VVREDVIADQDFDRGYQSRENGSGNGLEETIQ